jgi:release factor glutamine methyltransferase
MSPFDHDPTGAGSAGYSPMVTEEHAKRIRQWHENAYRSAKAEAGSGQRIAYLGTTLVVPPEVQPITGMSHLLGEAVLAEVREDDRVLDMGTGSGVNAILAASKATDVVAVDINPHAVDAARRNAERNGVADRIEVRHSDVFSDVDGGFDLIIFDPPFRWFAPRDWLEAATTDENYQAMTTFFRDARQHLTPAGRMLIFFGSSGDLAYLRRLIDEEAYAAEVVAQQDLIKDGWQVNYFTLRLTQAIPGNVTSIT